jgi:hypothetical protein
MTKAELTIEISDKTGIEKDKVLKTIECIMQSIKINQCLNKIRYREIFETFLIKDRAQKPLVRSTRILQLLSPNISSQPLSHLKNLSPSSSNQKRLKLMEIFTQCA